MQIEIPAVAFAAVLPFIDPKDLRPYLRGAWYGPHGEGTALAATNGTALVVYRFPTATTDGPAITLPHDLAAAAAKLRHDAEVHAPEDGPLRLNLGDGVRYFPRVDGAFPDWRIAVPASVSGEPAPLAYYAAKPLHALAKLFPRNGVRLYANGEGASVFEVVGQPISGVVMSLRNQPEPDAAAVIEATRG